jgi:hypothetical protein
MISINEKTKNLPKDVSSILDSAWSAKVNLDILNRNELSLDKSPVLLDLISAIFVKEVFLEDLPEKLSNSLDINLDSASKIACDIAGMRLYNIEKWLGVNIDRYILSLGGNISSYKKYPEEEVESLAEEKKYFLEQTRSDADFFFIPKNKNPYNYEPEIDIEKEKNDAPNVFKKHILDLIASHESTDITERYNDILVLALEDTGFRSELVSALQNNHEIISNVKLIIDDKEQNPTIGNWLKDFIKTNGSDVFDDLQVIEYLNLSKNSKKLEDKDRSLLRKIFKLYKNIAFFPESLAGVNRDNWQIIPLPDNELTHKPVVDVLEKGFNEESFSSESKNNSLKDFSLEKAQMSQVPPPPLSDNDKRLLELKNALVSYHSSTLEYKAIAQEIKRLAGK